MVFFFFQADDGIRDKLVTGVQTCAFLFQAEDGIRDKLVTGVQTCALPILIAMTSRVSATISRPDRVDPWTASILAKKPVRLATVAMANKTARIIWAVLSRGEPFRHAAAA